jgi:hypothetical protein
MEYDTDPSTPGAKRLSEPRAGDSAISKDKKLASTAAAEVPSRVRHNTDPGIAPPPAPLPVPIEAMGIVVPPVARTPNDTVDALLEGIRREQPQPNTTPPQVPAHDEPKVVIERPLLAQTVRIRVSGSKVSVEPYGSAATDTTTATARPIVGRMAIAVLAGVVVVMLIFVLLQRISAQVGYARAPALPAPVVPRAAAPSSPGEPPVTTDVPLPPAVETTPATRAAIQSPPPETSAAASSVPAVASTSPKPAQPRPSKPKTKAAPPATRPASDDLGEFKPAF